jgi:hypothetical protein
MSRQEAVEQVALPGADRDTLENIIGRILHGLTPQTRHEVDTFGP